MANEINKLSLPLNSNGSLFPTLRQSPLVPSDDAIETAMSVYHRDGVLSYPAKARCYSLRIYKNGVLVRDYLPVDYIGIPMLWDKVDKKLYPSAGTDQLIGGPVLGTFYLNGFTISIK